jgi:CelD/BcsL family acetyltransferase involved in cellulose biosynthesis
MRRKGRRLAENGRVKFFLASNYEDIDFVMDKLSEQKIAQLAEKGGESILSNQGALNCYKDFAKYFRNRGLGIVSALWVGDRIVATNYSVIFRGRFYYILLSFEKGKLSKYSPGAVLLEHLMQYAFEQGVEIFDFTIGDEGYKSVWCEKRMGLYSCLHGINHKGKIYAYLLGKSLDIRIALARCDVLRRLVRRGRRIRGLLA